MKWNCLMVVMLSLCITRNSFAQKKPIDPLAYQNWSSVDGGVISNNGNYVIYIHNANCNKKTLRTAQIMGMENKWQRSFTLNGGYFCGFSEDSKWGVIEIAKDSICLSRLGTNVIDFISKIQSFKLVKNKFICLDRDRNLYIRNLSTGENKVLGNVSSFVINGTESLIYQTEAEQKIVWLNLIDNSESDILQDYKASAFKFDMTRKKVAFLINGSKRTSIGYYSKELNIFQVLASEKDFARLGHITSVDGFSLDGQRVLLNVELPEKTKDTNQRQTNISVRVWSYQDKDIDAPQPQRAAASYLFEINLATKAIRRLQQISENISPDHFGDKYLIYKAKEINREEQLSGYPNGKNEISVVSSLSGVRLKLPAVSGGTLSPNGQYFIYYSSNEKCYYSYEISSNRVKRLAEDIDVTSWNPYYTDSLNASELVDAIVGWVKTINGYEVLISDQFDIWQVDLKGIHKSINITDGLGRKNNIIFYPISQDYSLPVVKRNDTFLLSAFNRITKENGFYKKTIDVPQSMTKLTMGNFLYYVPKNDIADGGSCPKKARYADAYLVKRSNASESPNYYYTKDLISYTKVSDVHPERDYNWLTSEVVSYKLHDGRNVQGILYKPEDFNPNKKYPVIFYYYEQLSNNANVYVFPKPSVGPINIPLYVSNGYLVFCPDIYYHIGEPGPSALDCILAARDFMSAKTYVDTLHLGLQGHSFGGYETNYVVTQTNKFAAACSASGPTDFVSGYGGTFGWVHFRQNLYEYGQNRMGTTLWQNSSLYIKNSPVFFIDKITTPILIMHNRNDDAVPFQQGLEFFLGLRRLNKKAWLLEYAGESHTIANEDAANDYSSKTLQFFDHFLKGNPAPFWIDKNE